MYFSKEDVQTVLDKLVQNCGIKPSNRVQDKASLVYALSNKCKLMITYPVKLNNTWNAMEFKLVRVQTYDLNGSNILKTDLNSKYTFDISSCSNTNELYSLILQELVKYKKKQGY